MKYLPEPGTNVYADALYIVVAIIGVVSMCALAIYAYNWSAIQ